MHNLEKIKVVFNKAIIEDLDGNQLANVETVSSNPSFKSVISEEEAEVAQAQSTVGVTSIIFAIITGLLIVFLLGIHL